MKFLLLIMLLGSLMGFSQTKSPGEPHDWHDIYRASATKINDLVNTKLDVSFDYSKSWMYGKAWITLHPHFYPTDSLNLDAHSMTINEVSMIKKKNRIPLKYKYDGLHLRITLDKTYFSKENFTIFIDYIAKPNEIKQKESGAISDDKGLYFINPLGTDKNKPTQIWTQGETESNSGWFPTIDKPDQKMTDEIAMTVEDKYQTLSNGLLVSSKKNKDGTRTDTWKMDLPHAPYLVMMAIGEYAIVKDSYKGKPVDYYVEKEYAPVARKIFGETPEMIGYFSRILNFDYPWQKYDQVVGRDYVSGAMENTTATLHGEAAEQDARQLVDGNSWEYAVAHELFHQWFGDLVTCESWANLTLNESFADYSETLWVAYKYGKDAADEYNYNAMEAYFQRGGDKEDLVRFHYRDALNMFDAVSYQKGGRILGMLRNYVGDSAFFKSLNLYLNTKKFQSAEAQELRLAFEQVTGQDLNWFWNQWYYGAGHPKLDISYSYNPDKKTAGVFVKQTQEGTPFKFRIAVDVYQGKEKKRYYEWIDSAADTLNFPVAAKPDLINVDGDKILLCEKNDHKTLDNFIFQYYNAGLYLDRREAVDFAATKQSSDPKALAFLKTALNDNYYGIRLFALQKLNLGKDSIRNVFEPIIAGLANNDPKNSVRAEAILNLGKYEKDLYKNFFLKSLNDSSYTIAGNSLIALGEIDSSEALSQAKILSAEKVKGALASAIEGVYYRYSGESEFDSLAARFNQAHPIYRKFGAAQLFALYLKKVNNAGNFRKGIDLIVGVRDSVSKMWGPQVDNFFNQRILKDLAAAKEKAGQTDLSAYINSKMPAPPENKKPAQDVSRNETQKYDGKYDFFGGSVNVASNPDKSLDLKFAAGAEMQLTPVSDNKFTVKNKDGYTVEFILDENNQAKKLIMSAPEGKIQAQKAE